MKKISILFLIFVLSIFSVACGAKDKVEDTNDKVQETSQKDISKVSSEATKTQVVTEVSNDIKEQAKKEGVSVEKLQLSLDGLVELSAQKYGITKEEYIKQTEDRGETVLSEWQLASENMGMSITDIYQYEKAKGDNLTDDQKATMKGMNDALKIAEAEIGNIENIDTTEVENMLGIQGNNSGKIQVVSMTDKEQKEAFAYKVDEITEDYTDTSSILFEYISSVNIGDLDKHYDQLLKNTQGYSKIGTPSSKVILYQGTINNTAVYVELDQSQDGKAKVSTYIDLTTKK